MCVCLKEGKRVSECLCVNVFESKKEKVFADDITAYCTNKEAMQEIIKTYEAFSSYTGIKLNVPKTEILILGKSTNTKEKFTITHNKQDYAIFDQESLKICGITFSNNFELAYEHNVIEKIAKLQKKLLIWRQRNLSLEGKILITKTFGISQLIYSMQATYVRDLELKKIEDIIFRFIWNTKQANKRVIGKINRSQMKEQIERGGLKAPCIFSIDKALKYKHAIRCLTNNHPVALITNKRMYDVGINWGDYSISKNKKSINKDDYLLQIAKTHETLGNKIRQDIKSMSREEVGIHKNYFSFVQNSKIADNFYLNSYQTDLARRLNAIGISKVSQLVDINQDGSVTALAAYQIKSTLPKEWFKLLSKTTRIHEELKWQISLSANKWKALESVTTRDINNRLKEPKIDVEEINYVTQLLLRRHKKVFTLNKNPFKMLRFSTRDCKARAVQYKILHNIYPTMKHLFLWKIKENENCSLCGIPEDLRHAIFDCPVAAKVWTDVWNLVEPGKKQGLNGLKYEDILLGISASGGIQSMTLKEKQGFDTLLIHLKRKLILQRENKCIIPNQLIGKEIANIRKCERMQEDLKNLSELRWTWITENET